MKQEPTDTLSEVIDFLITKRLADTHTSLPGIIESFNPDTQLARVSLNLTRVRITKNDQGEQVEESIAIAPIIDVPVQFPSGGGFHVTFPMSSGDECLVVFSERAIDNWLRFGGIQKPIDKRMHEYTDAFAIPGIKSIPNALSSFSTNSLNLGTDDGITYIDIAEGTIKINGDAFGGLVEVAELTAKLNEFVANFNAHSHANAGANNTVQPNFSESDYENESVVHG